MGLDVRLVGGNAVDGRKVDVEGSTSGSSDSSEANIELVGGDAVDGRKVDEEGIASAASHSSEVEAGDEGGSWGDDISGGGEEASGDDAGREVGSIYC